VLKRLWQVIGAKPGENMRLLHWVIAGLVALVLLILAGFGLDMLKAYDRVRARGTVIATPFGDVEFTHGGAGRDVLVIHGSGGGYDQGELIAEAVLGNGFHWITPSRFGYLGSGFNDGATWDDQAHAYAVLLDSLAIDEVAVVAMSQGGPSALLFALLYPGRVTSLTLISCGVAASQAAGQVAANEKGDRLAAIFEHDIVYWTISKFFKKQLMALIGVGPEIYDGLTERQRQLAVRFIDEMNPVSLRSDGAAFDNRARMPGERIAAIAAPTLILHAADDGLQLYHNAEFAAAEIPNARLIRFEAGGHFIIGTEQQAISLAVASHIARHATTGTEEIESENNLGSE
jgi:pimeloyl-ACP methyl ester carboxylesterase